ncbi:MAG: epoxide hydrolase family protein [Acidimicrobiia bacterium]
MSNEATTTTTASPIRPFRIQVPEKEIEDLRDRLAATRWPVQPDGTGWERGVPLGYLQGIADHWRNDFHWAAREAELNRFPQYVTTVDGQDIHFVHAPSPEPGAMPLVLLHGWPVSFVEFSRVIDPLIDPLGHGGRAEDAFHVVVPSIPGFGYSTPVKEPGWSTGRVARAVVELMHRLGYYRYGAHGGDVGAGVAAGLGPADSSGVIGVHVATDPRTAVSFAMFSGDPAQTPGLSEEERGRVERMKQISSDDMGYLQIQSTRPQTLAYGLNDSPVAQLAWIVEKFREWTDPAADLPEEAVDRDHLLTNVALYWFTRSGASTAHFLYDSMHAQDWGEEGTTPTGFAVFGRDPVTRRLMDPEHKVEHWSEFERGGHFPAMEVPDLLVDDVRAFFRPMR